MALSLKCGIVVLVWCLIEGSIIYYAPSPSNYIVFWSIVFASIVTAIVQIVSWQVDNIE